MEFFNSNYTLSIIGFFLKNQLFTFSNLLQSLAIVAGFFLAYMANNLLKKVLKSRFLHLRTSEEVKKKFKFLIFPLVWTLIQWTMVAASIEFQWNYAINQIVAQFVSAWLIGKVLTLIIHQPGLERAIFITTFSIAGLNALGLLPHLIDIMESFAINVGELHISLFSIVKGGATFIFLLWGTLSASRWVEQKFKKKGKIAPSLQELFAKLIRVSFLAMSILITLSSVGLDLSAFAIFGGTIGVGIGFGLQKVVSNLICGIILLLDRSIKPGDVVALDNGKSYGEINRLGARCVSVRTRSGKEHLIPNEEFIIHKSENWSLSDSLIRLSLPMRAGLESDVILVMKLLVLATENVARVITTPAPGARLKAFTESAIEFELRVWINDPHNGVSKVKSDIYINIWKLFKEHKITIPHQQSDIHLPKISLKKLSENQEPSLHE